MRNIALAIIVLALTATAMADVNITIARLDVKDLNTVTIGYDCNEGEEVRAFAIDIDVNNQAFAVGSDGFPSDPNYADYYVCPGSILFDVNDVCEVTYISGFGNPIAEQDANGGVLEIASLYAAADPNHQNPPAVSGDVAYFGVDCTSAYTLQIDLSENSKRGGIVLKDPNETPTHNLPLTYIVDCNCWTCPGQPYGDATGDGKINIYDYLAFKKAVGTNKDDDPHGTGNEEYNCCSDFTHDGKVNIYDYLELRKGIAAGIVYPNPCVDMYCP